MGTSNILVVLSLYFCVFALCIKFHRKKKKKKRRKNDDSARPAVTVCISVADVNSDKCCQTDGICHCQT